jgi:hypothetical protein
LHRTINNSLSATSAERNRCANINGAIRSADSPKSVASGVAPPGRGRIRPPWKLPLKSNAAMVVGAIERKRDFRSTGFAFMRFDRAKMIRSD